jgi:putative spermidine/putrescine transport system ATP-binding protein
VVDPQVDHGQVAKQGARTKDASAFIRFVGVRKAFGATTVVDALDLDVERGEFLSLLGPSGSGKTTLLMMLAGFEAPSAGSIQLDGRRIEALPPHRREMGVVFQSYALFPHMTVAENLAFPLMMRRMPRAERDRRVRQALDLVRLGSLADRRPAQLSGGQQQRIALARALVYEPKVVLMDEPLSALDKQLREHMQLELRALHRTLGLTVIFVTHDQGEALTMSNRVAVLNHGRIEQLDTPSGLYDRPRTRFVAEFIGETNLIEGTVEAVAAGSARVSTKDAVLHCRCNETVSVGATVLVSVRPEMVDLADSPLGSNALAVRVTDEVYHGDHVRLHLSWGDRLLVAKVGRRDGARPVGTRAYACFGEAECTLVLP